MGEEMKSFVDLKALLGKCGALKEELLAAQGHPEWHASLGMAIGGLRTAENAIRCYVKPKPAAAPRLEVEQTGEAAAVPVGGS